MRWAAGANLFVNEWHWRKPVLFKLKDNHV